MFVLYRGEITEEIFLEDMSKHIEEREAIRESQYGFTKANFCLTTLVALHGITALMDNRRATDVTCLAFCKSSDMVPHNVLAAAKLERYRCDK